MDSKTPASSHRVGKNRRLGRVASGLNWVQCNAKDDKYTFTHLAVI